MIHEIINMREQAILKCMRLPKDDRKHELKRIKAEYQELIQILKNDMKSILEWNYDRP